MKRFLALCLCVSVLLSGCGLVDLLPKDGLLGILLGLGGSEELVAYEDMEYVRPDMEEHDRVLEECCEVARTSKSIDEVTEAIYRYYDLYDWYYTCYWLADIEYSRDFTSQKWQEEYLYCSENISRVDAGLETLYTALAQSPIRDKLEGEDYFGADYFDSYEGESVYDEELMALLEEESRLIGVYYDLCAQADGVEYYSEEYFTQFSGDLCQTLIDLVLVRRDIAEHTGYDSYVSFAWDFYYYRDYTPDQAMDYMESIRQEMGPLYAQVSATDVWGYGYGYCSESETFEYVKEAAQAMGGIVKEAFDAMDQAGLYDISYSETKFSTSFEVFLPYYYEPYVFVCPDRSEYDKLTFAHEFGHFAADYAAWGSYAGTDVQEVFSQAMEYLSLEYVSDTSHLEQYKLADCLSTYVEQSAYACFEQKLYALPEEELTVENVFALYEDTCRGFGIDFEVLGWDTRDLVTIPHFYTDPLYIISYVVSNDAAFQIYRLEREKSGAGLAVYTEHLATECYYFLEYMEEAGLENPFAPGRVEEAAQTLTEVLAGSAR